MQSKNTASAQAKQFTENIGDHVEKTVEQVENKVETIKDKVSNNLSHFADKVHQKADSGQSFLDDKAHSVGNIVHQTVEKANKIGHRAADAISESSDYIKNFDLEGTKESVKAVIKERPEVTIAAAALLGLLVGFLVGRKTKMS